MTPISYIVMDAEGYYGDYATVYSIHPTLDGARKAAGRRKSIRVSTDGGFGSTHYKGAQIHREFASKYRSL